MKIRNLAVVAGIVAGLSFNTAFASEVAFVDVQKVVASSGQVQQLKKDQEAKAKEFKAFIDKAKKDVAAVTDTKKKQALAEKYDKQYISKREALEKDYASKLKVIEKSISEVISEQAKLKGYDMVVSKDVVLYGTTDITEEVINVVKNDAKKTTKKK